MQFHTKKFSEAIQEKYTPYIEWKNLSTEEIKNPKLWQRLFEAKTLPLKHKSDVEYPKFNEDLIYKTLFYYFPEDKKTSSLEGLDFVTPQRIGNCSWKSLMMFCRFKCGSAANYKIFINDLKFQTIQNLLFNLKDLQANNKYNKNTWLMLKALEYSTKKMAKYLFNLNNASPLLMQSKKLIERTRMTIDILSEAYKLQEQYLKSNPGLLTKENDLVETIEKLKSTDKSTTRKAIIAKFKQSTITTTNDDINHLLLNINATPPKQDLPTLYCDTMSVEDFITSLDRCLEYGKEIKESNEQLIAFLTHHVFNTLPMPDVEGLNEDNTINCFWEKLNPQQRLTCFEKLEQLCHLYESTIFNNNMPYPEHKANLAKIYAVGDFLITKLARSSKLDDLLGRIRFTLPLEEAEFDKEMEMVMQEELALDSDSSVTLKATKEYFDARYGLLQNRWEKRTFSCFNSQSYTKEEFIEKIREYYIYKLLLKQHKDKTAERIENLVKIFNDQGIVQETLDRLNDEELFGLFDFFQSNYSPSYYSYSSYNNPDDYCTITETKESWKKKKLPEKQKLFQELKEGTDWLKILNKLSKNYGSYSYEQKEKYRQAFECYYKNLEFKLVLKLINGDILEQEQTREEQQMTIFLNLMRKIYTKNYYAWHGYDSKSLLWNNSKQPLDPLEWQDWEYKVVEDHNQELIRFSLITKGGCPNDSSVLKSSMDRSLSKPKSYGYHTGIHDKDSNDRKLHLFPIESLGIERNGEREPRKLISSPILYQHMKEHLIGASKKRSQKDAIQEAYFSKPTNTQRTITTSEQEQYILSSIHYIDGSCSSLESMRDEHQQIQLFNLLDAFERFPAWLKDIEHLAFLKQFIIAHPKDLFFQLNSHPNLNKRLLDFLTTQLLKYHEKRLCDITSEQLNQFLVFQRSIHKLYILITKHIDTVDLAKTDQIQKLQQELLKQLEITRKQSLQWLQEKHDSNHDKGHIAAYALASFANTRSLNLMELEQVAVFSTQLSQFGHESNNPLDDLLLNKDIQDSHLWVKERLLSIKDRNQLYPILDKCVATSVSELGLVVANGTFEMWQQLKQQYRVKYQKLHAELKLQFEKHKESFSEESNGFFSKLIKLYELQTQSGYRRPGYLRANGDVLTKLFNNPEFEKLCSETIQQTSRFFGIDDIKEMFRLIRYFNIKHMAEIFEKCILNNITNNKELLDITRQANSISWDAWGEDYPFFLKKNAQGQLIQINLETGKVLIDGIQVVKTNVPERWLRDKQFQCLFGCNKIPMSIESNIFIPKDPKLQCYRIERKPSDDTIATIRWYNQQDDKTDSYLMLTEQQINELHLPEVLAKAKYTYWLQENAEEPTILIVPIREGEPPTPSFKILLDGRIVAVNDTRENLSLTTIEDKEILKFVENLGCHSNDILTWQDTTGKVVKLQIPILDSAGNWLTFDRIEKQGKIQWCWNNNHNYHICSSQTLYGRPSLSHFLLLENNQGKQLAILPKQQEKHWLTERQSYQDNAGIVFSAFREEPNRTNVVYFNPKQHSLDLIYPPFGKPDISCIAVEVKQEEDLQAELYGNSLESQLFVVYLTLMQAENNQHQASEQLDKLRPLRRYTDAELDILLWIANSKQELKTLKREQLNPDAIGTRLLAIHLIKENLKKYPLVPEEKIHFKQRHPNFNELPTLINDEYNLALGLPQPSAKGAWDKFITKQEEIELLQWSIKTGDIILTESVTKYLDSLQSPKTDGGCIITPEIQQDINPGFLEAIIKASKANPKDLFGDSNSTKLLSYLSWQKKPLEQLFKSVYEKITDYKTTIEELDSLKEQFDFCLITCNTQKTLIANQDLASLFYCLIEYQIEKRRAEKDKLKELEAEWDREWEELSPEKQTDQKKQFSTNYSKRHREPLDKYCQERKKSVEQIMQEEQTYIQYSAWQEKEFPDSLGFPIYHEDDYHPYSSYRGPNFQQELSSFYQQIKKCCEKQLTDRRVYLEDRIRKHSSKQRKEIFGSTIKEQKENPTYIYQVMFKRPTLLSDQAIDYQPLGHYLSLDGIQQVKKDDLEQQFYHDQEQAETLKDQIASMLNKLPQDNEVTKHALEVVSGKRSILTINDAVGLFLKRNQVLWCKQTFLRETEEIDEVQAKIADYLLTVSRMQQVERGLKILKQIESLIVDDPNKTILEKQFQDAIGAKRCYDPREYPEFLVYETLTKIMLFPEQVEKLKQLVARMYADDAVCEEFYEKQLELIMGKGKSKVLSPLISYVKANGKNLSVLVLTDPLYNSGSQDMQNSLSILGKRVQTIEYSRQTSNMEKLIQLQEQIDRAIKDGIVCTARVKDLQTLDAMQDVLLEELYQSRLHLNEAQIIRIEQVKKLTSTSIKTISEMQKTFPYLNREEAEQVLFENSMEQQIKILTEINEKIANNGLFTLDELDTQLYARQQLNLPVGIKIPISRLGAKITTRIWSTLMTNQEINQIMPIAESVIKNEQSLLDKDMFSRKIKFILATEEFEYYQEDLKSALSTIIDDKDINITEPELKNYYLSYLRIIQDQDDEKANKFYQFLAKLNVSAEQQHRNIAQSMAIIRMQLAGNKLQESLSKSTNMNFGRSKLQSSLEIAIPYAASNQPKEISQSELSFFRDPWETVNKTCLMYLSTSWQDDEQTKKLMNLIHNQLSAQEQDSIFIEKLTEIFGVEIIKALTCFDWDDPIILRKIKSIIEIRRQDNDPIVFELMLQYLNQLVFPLQINSYATQVNSTAQDFAAQPKILNGYSGSRRGEYTWHGRLERDSPQGTEDQIFGIITNGKHKCFDAIKSTKPEELITELAGLQEINLDNYSSFIDAGGLFKGISNQEVALKLLHSLPTCKQVIAYYDEVTPGVIKLALLKRDDSTQSSPEPIFIDGSDPETIAKALNVNISELNNILFNFYDQAHIIGSDLPNPLQGRAFITMSDQLIKDLLTQGVMRMRQLISGGQFVDFVVPEKIAVLVRDKLNLEKTHKLTPEELFEYSKQIQNEQEQQDHYDAIHQKLQHYVKKSIKEHRNLLIKQSEFSEALIFHQKSRDLILSLEEDLFNKYGRLESYQDPIVVLEQKRQKLLEKIKTTDLLSTEEIVKLEKSFADVIAAAKINETQLPKAISSGQDCSTAGEMEVAASVEKQTDIQQELQQDLSVILHDGKLEAKPFRRWGKAGEYSHLWEIFEPTIEQSKAYLTDDKFMEKGGLNSIKAILEFKKDWQEFKEIFDENIFISEDALNVFKGIDPTQGLLSHYETPIHQVLLIEESDQVKVVILSQRESVAFATLLSKVAKDTIAQRKVWLLEPYGVVIDGTHSDWSDPFKVDFTTTEQDSLLINRARALTQVLILKRDIAHMNQLLLVETKKSPKTSDSIVSPITYWFNEQTPNDPGRLRKMKQRFVKQSLLLNEEDSKVFSSSDGELIKKLICKK